jgi:hypothetical protein
MEPNPLPILEFVCPHNHVSERLILSAEKAAKAEYIPDCDTCGNTAHRAIITPPTPQFAPGGAGGFHKPSAGRATGGADPTQYVKQAFEEMGGNAGIKKMPEMMKHKPKSLNVGKKS